jgi:hypothetical protein
MDRLPTRVYSWGPGKDIPNSVMALDFGRRLLFVPTTGDLYIAGIRSLDQDTAELNLIRWPSRQGDPEYKIAYIIHFLSDGSFWMEYIGEGQFYFMRGQKNIYYKLDGPERHTRGFVVNDFRVRLREDPGLMSNTVRLLDKDEIVTRVLQSDTESKVGSQIAKWAFVITSKGDFGWVYEPYLSEPLASEK